MEHRNGNGTGNGFGWDRRSGQPFRELHAPPDSTREEFGVRTMLAVTIEPAVAPPDGPADKSPGIAPKIHYRRPALAELIVRHVGPPLENVFLLRHLRARAVESERSRISRDIHDGILQTLLSLDIQLDVLRRKLPRRPSRQARVGTLQKTIQQESEELRGMVTDLRPLRVESADMRELMRGFAERFRNESAWRWICSSRPQFAVARPYLQGTVPDLP